MGVARQHLYPHIYHDWLSRIRSGGTGVVYYPDARAKTPIGKTKGFVADFLSDGPIVIPQNQLTRLAQAQTCVL